MMAWLQRARQNLPFTEIAWLMVFLCMGLVMVFRMPPFQVMDEYKHFYKSYALSEGNILCSSDENGKAGVYVPENIRDAGHIFDTEGMEYRYDKKVTPEEITRGNGVVPTNSYVFIEHAFCETPSWSSLPQALGVGIARIFQMDISGIFFAGRLSNLLISACILFFALRLLPLGKHIFMAVTLLPMFVQQVASYSLDASHYTLLFLFFAYTLRLATQEETMTTKQSILLGALSFLGVYAKFGYMFLVLLIFLLPKKSFATQKRYWMTMGGILLMHLLSFFALRHIFFVGDIVNAGSVNRGGQILWILQHPLAYAEVLMQSFNVHGPFYLRNIFGVLGWLDYPLYGMHYLILGVLLIVLIASPSSNTPRLNKIQRSLLLGLGTISALILLTILYAIDDPVGAPIISLMQGKYFLPLLPLFLLGLQGIELHKHTKTVLVLGVTLLTLPMLWSVQTERYYDTRPVTVVPRTGQMQMLSIDASNPLQQQIYLREEGLRGISFWIGNALQPDGSVGIQLRDADCQKTLHSEFLRARDVPVPGYYHFRFPGLALSAESQYCLTITPSLQEERAPLQVEATKSDTFKDGSLTLGGKKVDGDLAMIFHYTR